MKNKYIIFISTLVILLSLSNAAYAVGFYGSVAAKGGLGTSGSESDSVESRDLYRFGAEATLGLHFGPFLVGGSAEYNLWNQRTEPSDVGNTNMGGKQINFAPVIGVGLGSLMFAVKPHLYSKLTLNEENASSETVEYHSPEFPAYTAQINYGFGVMSFIGLEYSSVTYKKIKAGSSETSLSSDDRPNYSGWGIVYGFKF